MREHSNTAEWHILKCPQVFNGPKPARINHFDGLTQNTEKKKCCNLTKCFCFLFSSFILITSRSLCEQFDWRSVDGSKTLSQLDGCVLYAHAVYHALPGLCMGFIYDNWVIKTLCLLSYIETWRLWRMRLLTRICMACLCGDLCFKIEGHIIATHWMCEEITLCTENIWLWQLPWHLRTPEKVVCSTAVCARNSSTLIIKCCCCYSLICKYFIYFIE